MLDKLANSMTGLAKKYSVTLLEQRQDKSKAEYFIEAKYIQINSIDGFSHRLDQAHQQHYMCN